MGNYEIETVDENGKKGLALKDVSKMESEIESVCRKIEKAEGGYLKVAEQVYLLNKHKAHKDSGYSNFKDYIRDKTGMGATTAHTLINYWKLHIKAGSNNDIIEWLETRGMREVVQLTRKMSDVTKAIEDTLKATEDINDGTLDASQYIEAAIETREAERNLEEKSESAKEDCGSVEGEDEENEFNYSSNLLSNYATLDDFMKWIEYKINIVLDEDSRTIDDTDIRVELHFYNK